MPKAFYFGLDVCHYNLDEADISVMEKFYLVDLEKDDFAEIPDEHFDAVILAHVLEHIRCCLEVLEKILKKIAPAGVIYIEYPSIRSLSLPNMKGSLNFCDDPSHVRLYDLKEIGNLLLAHELRILRGGVKRDWVRIPFFPAALLLYYLKTGQINTVPLWDLLGSADFIIAQRK